PREPPSGNRSKQPQAVTPPGASPAPNSPNADNARIYHKRATVTNRSQTLAATPFPRRPACPPPKLPAAPALRTGVDMAMVGDLAHNVVDNELVDAIFLAR